MEHVLEELYDLQSQHVLSHVIPHLEDGGLPHSPRGELGGERGQGWGGGGERELHYIHVDKANEYQYQLHYTVGLIQ